MVIKMCVGLMIAGPAWYTLYYSAFVTISIGIGTVFIYFHWYAKIYIYIFVLNLITILKQQFH